LPHKYKPLKVMNNETFYSPSVHHGRNIKRLREILGVKQEAIAAEFNIRQQAVSDWESKALIGDEILERIANNEPALVCHHCNQPVINQIDKLTEMMERLLKAEQEKSALLEKFLAREK